MSPEPPLTSDQQAIVLLQAQVVALEQMLAEMMADRDFHREKARQFSADLLKALADNARLRAELNKR
jgi:hypothetical protein